MVTFRVPGMRCNGCAKSVTAAIVSAAPGAQVVVDLERKLVQVRSAAAAAQLARAIQAAGYAGEHVTSVESDRSPARGGCCCASRSADALDVRQAAVVPRASCCG